MVKLWLIIQKQSFQFLQREKRKITWQTFQYQKTEPPPFLVKVILNVTWQPNLLLIFIVQNSNTNTNPPNPNPNPNPSPIINSSHGYLFLSSAPPLTPSLLNNTFGGFFLIIFHSTQFPKPPLLEFPFTGLKIVAVSFDSILFKKLPLKISFFSWFLFLGRSVLITFFFWVQKS